MFTYFYEKGRGDGPFQVSPVCGQVNLKKEREHNSEIPEKT